MSPHSGNGPTGEEQSGEYAGQPRQQPEAQLFDPQSPPAAVQVQVFEDLNQVVCEKLKLKEAGIDQEVY